MPRRCNVLIVEDEILIRLDLADRLSSRGCKVYEAGSADDAISVLERHSEISVVFTDIQMPGEMDGVVLAQYVKKRWPPTIIVVSSGKVLPLPSALGEDMRFIAKPYNEAELVSVIADVAARLASR